MLLLYHREPQKGTEEGNNSLLRRTTGQSPLAVTKLNIHCDTLCKLRVLCVKILPLFSVSSVVHYPAT